MTERLIIDETTVYEIDEECLRQQETKEKEEKSDTPKKEPAL